MFVYERGKEQKTYMSAIFWENNVQKAYSKHWKHRSRRYIAWEIMKVNIVIVFVLLYTSARYVNIENCSIQGAKKSFPMGFNIYISYLGSFNLVQSNTNNYILIASVCADFIWEWNVCEILIINQSCRDFTS